MTDKKFTDEEIIKALECHFNEELDKEPFRCVDCPLYNDTSPSCTEALKSYALDLINRYKAENKRLNKKVEELSEVLSDTIRIRYEEAKAEAYKEFAKKIKEEIENAYNNNSKVVYEHISKHAECPNYEFIATVQGKMNTLYGLSDFIDNLLKEMIGEEE